MQKERQPTFHNSFIFLKSKATSAFWKAFNKLPIEIQELAREKYRLWEINPRHPSLFFKKLYEDVYSVRINQDYRAVGILNGDTVIWFWIGSHPEYDELIGR